MAKKPLPTAFELTTEHRPDGWRMTTSLENWRVLIKPHVRSLTGAIGLTLPDALRNLADAIEQREPGYRTQR